MADIDWKQFPNFSEAEFRCKHCGLAKMDPAFLSKLQAIRNEYGRPMFVNSGYRCPTYNQRVSTTGPDGPHTTGRAADIRVFGAFALDLLDIARGHGITGVGVQQKGAFNARFLHLDIVTTGRPTIWSY